MVTIPNVADLPEAEARRRLRDAGYRGKFHVETRAGCEWERNIAEGAVCRTHPAIGQKVSRFITLHLAGPSAGTDGRGRFGRMPNLLGWPVDKARAHLKKSGYTDVEVHATTAKHNTSEDVTCRPNLVCFQLPAPNRKAYFERTVRIQFGQPPAPVKADKPPPASPGKDKDEPADKPDSDGDDSGSYFD